MVLLPGDGWLDGALPGHCRLSQLSTHYITTFTYTYWCMCCEAAPRMGPRAAAAAIKANVWNLYECCHPDSPTSGWLTGWLRVVCE